MTTETDFLFGDWLTEVVKRVARGRDARIATAFWSADGIAELFGPVGAGDARIICDLAMGFTSPAALEALGAPDNDQLRHHVRLHTKVFISTEGMIVGSANVSGSALGLGHPSRWQLEAGTFHPSHTNAWSQAVEWFDALHGRSPSVGKQELEWAAIAYRPPRGRTPVAPRPGSLLDLVAAAPERFADVGFVVTGVNATKEQIDRALRSARNARSDLSKAEIGSWPRNGIFTDWNARDVKRWPRTFFELWLGRRKLSIEGFRGELYVEETGTVLARRHWRSVAGRVEIPLPDRKTIGDVDNEVARMLVGDEQGLLFASGHELAARLFEIGRVPAPAWTADPSGEVDPVS